MDNSGKNGKSSAFFGASGDTLTDKITEHHLMIKPMEGGHNSGRSYVHRIASHEEAEAWRRDIQTQVKEAKKQAHEAALLSEHGHSRLAFWRAKTLLFYESNPVQYGIAALIIFGFGVDISEAQVLPLDGTPESDFYLTADVFLTLIFCLELLVHLFAKSNDRFAPFMEQRSNWLDVGKLSLSPSLHPSLHPSLPPSFLSLSRALSLPACVRARTCALLSQAAARKLIAGLTDFSLCLSCWIL